MNKDMIYRQDVIDVLEHERDEALVRLYDYQLAIDAVMGLPSARQWIPVTERLPEDGCQCIVTVKVKHAIGYSEYEVGTADYVDGDFILSEDLWGVEDIIAWMPLPQPYKGGQDE